MRVRCQGVVRSGTSSGAEVLNRYQYVTDRNTVILSDIDIEHAVEGLVNHCLPSPTIVEVRLGIKENTYLLGVF